MHGESASNNVPITSPQNTQNTQNTTQNTTPSPSPPLASPRLPSTPLASPQLALPSLPWILPLLRNAIRPHAGKKVPITPGNAPVGWATANLTRQQQAQRPSRSKQWRLSKDFPSNRGARLSGVSHTTTKHWQPKHRRKSKIRCLLSHAQPLSSLYVFAGANEVGLPVSEESMD